VVVPRPLTAQQRQNPAEFDLLFGPRIFCFLLSASTADGADWNLSLGQEFLCADFMARMRTSGAGFVAVRKTSPPGSHFSGIQ